MHSKCTANAATKPSTPVLAQPAKSPTATITDTKHTVPTEQSNVFDVPDRYSEQVRFHRQWEEKMERLNEKYGLDCFSSSELDSESDEGEDYRYEHKYETLI